jgi:ribosome-associated translation inhibitor RaiA
MRTHLKTDGLTTQSKQMFEDYTNQKIERIINILTPYSLDEDTVKLNIHVEHAQKHNTFIVKVQLDIPHKSFHHEEAKHKIMEVIDLSFDNIAKQLRDFLRKRKDNHKNGTPPSIEVPKDDYTIGD